MARFDPRCVADGGGGGLPAASSDTNAQTATAFTYDTSIAGHGVAEVATALLRDWWNGRIRLAACERFPRDSL
jgi:hypothetical protein